MQREDHYPDCASWGDYYNPPGDCSCDDLEIVAHELWIEAQVDWMKEERCR
jgi:hypothetical protein